jgi:hypothetical protein
MKKVIKQGLLAAGIIILATVSNVAKATKVDPAHNMSAAETHWAFIPLVKPQVPSFSKNPVDSFILQKLTEQGLGLNDVTDKRSLVRRVTYDLTGLPPTYDEVMAFVADKSPDAYERLVERLLASPAYGERWARHWLDVARYSDTQGVFKGGRYAFSHTYRDYVIKSFNEDKPYDQFILEQIAADHLELGEDKSALAAMGFLTLGRTFFGRKDFIIDDQIDVVTRGLQGLTVTCARCHDHKFDPIPTADYYSLHGVFASSENPEELPIISYPDNESDYAAYQAEVERLEEAIEVKSDEVIDKFLIDERKLAGNYLNAVNEGKSISDEDAFKVFAGSRKIRPEILRLWIDYFASEEAQAQPVLQKWFQEYAGINDVEGEKFYNEIFTAAIEDNSEGYGAVKDFLSEPGSPLNPDRKGIADWIGRKIRGDVGGLKAELNALEWTHPGAPMRAHILADVSEPKNSRIYKRGDPGNKGEEVNRHYLEILSGGKPKPFSKGSGRLELAMQIADKSNPLTARVFVNRVWGWHMGKEIVDTPSDFGVRTPEPVHIDLLNWLSASFIESGWSIKSLHRLIVLSQTYRQSSSITTKGERVDPGNQYWHHFPKARLDFESMRDTLLAVSGNLDITDPTTNRRTIYSYIDRQDMPGIFRTFDHPSPEATSPARFETVVPQQALFLMNSPFTIEQAKYLAARTETLAGPDLEERIQKTYQLVFQREVSRDELMDGLNFLKEFDANVPVAVNEGEEVLEPLNGWQLYCQALLLSNELMFLD